MRCLPYWETIVWKNCSIHGRVSLQTKFMRRQARKDACGSVIILTVWFAIYHISVTVCVISDAIP